MRAESWTASAKGLVNVFSHAMFTVAVLPVKSPHKHSAGSKEGSLGGEAGGCLAEFPRGQA